VLVPHPQDERVCEKQDALVLFVDVLQHLHAHDVAKGRVEEVVDLVRNLLFFLLVNELVDVGGLEQPDDELKVNEDHTSVEKPFVLVIFCKESYWEDSS
jgi:hypothetical protein